MKLQCQNPSCSRYMQVDTISKAVYVFRDGKLVMKDSECSECGQPRVDITEREDVDFARITVGKVGSMNRDQRAEILKKRASDHYKREIKPYKDHINHETAKEMNALVKGKL